MKLVLISDVTYQNEKYSSTSPDDIAFIEFAKECGLEYFGSKFELIPNRFLKRCSHFRTHAQSRGVTDEYFDRRLDDKFQTNWKKDIFSYYFNYDFKYIFDHKQEKFIIIQDQAKIEFTHERRMASQIHWF